MALEGVFIWERGLFRRSGVDRLVPNLARGHRHPSLLCTLSFFSFRLFLVLCVGPTFKITTIAATAIIVTIYRRHRGQS